MPDTRSECNAGEMLTSTHPALRMQRRRSVNLVKCGIQKATPERSQPHAREVLTCKRSGIAKKLIPATHSESNAIDLLVFVPVRLTL